MLARRVAAFEIGPAYGPQPSLRDGAVFLVYRGLKTAATIIRRSATCQIRPREAQTSRRLRRLASLADSTLG
jgi:hypothetical protein